MPDEPTGGAAPEQQPQPTGQPQPQPQGGGQAAPGTTGQGGEGQPQQGGEQPQQQQQPAPSSFRYRSKSGEEVEVNEQQMQAVIDTAIDMQSEMQDLRQRLQRYEQQGGGQNGETQQQDADPLEERLKKLEEHHASQSQQLFNTQLQTMLERDEWLQKYPQFRDEVRNQVLVEMNIDQKLTPEGAVKRVIKARQDAFEKAWEKHVQGKLSDADMADAGGGGAPTGTGPHKYTREQYLRGDIARDAEADLRRLLRGGAT